MQRRPNGDEPNAYDNGGRPARWRSQGFPDEILRIRYGQALSDPLHTVTTKDRFGLVTIKGENYQIADIGMRMLQPHELFAAQGFPANYVIDRDINGIKYSKAKQVARCGNAVPPPFAEQLVSKPS
ncbi:DNA cytosine methyltransferase [Bacillus velezensis]|uniref:DNA cytosine methyltransferase n=1 Tax=Bacillus velezensis TaxID=492670 RepID=UPI0039FC41C6